MKYFQPPYTLDNIDKQYKELAKILHPDKGGTTEDFQHLQREHALVKKVAETMQKNKPVGKFTRTAQSNGKVKKFIRRQPPVTITPVRPINISIDLDAAADFLELLTGGVIKKRK